MAIDLNVKLKNQGPEKSLTQINNVLKAALIPEKEQKAQELLVKIRRVINSDILPTLTKNTDAYKAWVQCAILAESANAQPQKINAAPEPVKQINEDPKPVSNPPAVALKAQTTQTEPAAATASAPIPAPATAAAPATQQKVQQLQASPATPAASSYFHGKKVLFLGAAIGTATILYASEAPLESVLFSAGLALAALTVSIAPKYLNKKPNQTHQPVIQAQKAEKQVAATPTPSLPAQQPAAASTAPTTPEVAIPSETIAPSLPAQQPVSANITPPTTPQIATHQREIDRTNSPAAPVVHNSILSPPPSFFTPPSALPTKKSSLSTPQSITTSHSTLEEQLAASDKLLSAVTESLETTVSDPRKPVSSTSTLRNTDFLRRLNGNIAQGPSNPKAGKKPLPVDAVPKTENPSDVDQTAAPLKKPKVAARRRPGKIQTEFKPI